MTIIAANIPDDLTALRQWVIWRYVQKPDKPKPDKVPHTTMGCRADVTKPHHWATFESALKAAGRPGFADGIGFVFAAGDPFCGVDLDHVWQSDGDEGEPWAVRILERFSDTYSEVSPSGQGVKIWCRAKPPHCGRWPIESGAIEVYSGARFFTVTGRSAGVRVITDHQADIEALVANLDIGRRQPQAHRVAGVIPQGQRHNTMVSWAGTMCRLGMAPEAVEAALQLVNQRQCDPPYPPEHVRKIVLSMERWER